MTSDAAPILVSTAEAARLLGLSVSTLEKWRFYRVPDTPPVVKIGRACRYRLRDIVDWAERRPSENTSNCAGSKDGTA